MNRRDEIRRRLGATGGRGRKLRGLAELLSPYRWRVVAMFTSLVIATGAALAPAPLAKLAIDQGIRHHDTGELDLIVVVFLISAVVYGVATYAQTYLVGWVGQRTGPGQVTWTRFFPGADRDDRSGPGRIEP